MHIKKAFVFNSLSNLIQQKKSVNPLVYLSLPKKEKCEKSLITRLSDRDLDLLKEYAVLVYYIHSDALKFLRQCDWLLFMEKYKDVEDVIRDYKLTVCHSDKSMLIKGLK